MTRKENGAKRKRLIKKRGSAIENIIKYDDYIKDVPELESRLGRHRVWLAVEHGGTWKFGSSKIIGYTGINPEDYAELTYELDGRKTDAILFEWFIELHRSNDRYMEIWDALHDYLEGYEKRPSKGARIYILREDYDSPDTPENPLVDLIWHSVMANLSNQDRKRLIKKLKG